MTTQYNWQSDADYRCKAGQITLQCIPEKRYLMVDGQGDPNHNSGYQLALQSLYAVSYRCKFMHRHLTYRVMPLEGLWWAEDMQAFVRAERQHWRWRMMIQQPDWVDSELLQCALEQVKARQEVAPDLRIETYQEAWVAQALHRGPYTDEGPLIQAIHEKIAEHGQLSGLHHEIYLNDPRRCQPQNLRTIIRQPFTQEAI